METHITDLSEDVMRCIANCLVKLDQPVTTSAKDCAAVAMTCKALSAMSAHAWKRCAMVAECQPRFWTLCEERECVHRGARHDRKYKLRLGPSCPIARRTAEYILDVSWMAIGVKKAANRFWDRDLTNCELVTNKTYRYTSVLAAPLKNNEASMLARMEAVHAHEVALSRHGVQREWGVQTVYEPCLYEVVRMCEWASEVGLSAAMVRLLEQYIDSRMKYDPHHAHQLQARFGWLTRVPELAFNNEVKEVALRYDTWLSEFDCVQELPCRYCHLIMHRSVSIAVGAAIQKRRLGKVTINCSPLSEHQSPLIPLTQNDITRFDERIILLGESVKLADDQTLRTLRNRNIDEITTVLLPSYSALMQQQQTY